MPAAFLFDIDGPLVDSVDLHARAWQKAFAHFGLDIPYEQVRSQIGKGGDQLLPVFVPASELESLGAEIEKYRGALFKREYLPRVRPFPRVRDLLARSKPCPDVFRVALGRTGAAPANAVVIGDTPYDAIAAGRAGLAAIGVLCVVR